jgi:hypothetical protein
MSYSPTIGRFLEQDPAGDINGPNGYQLEKSNTISFVDPTGTQAQSPIIPTDKPSKGHAPTTQPTTQPTNNNNPTPPTPPSNPTVAADDQLQALQLAGANYAVNDSFYRPYTHDCVAQSQGLEDYLNGLYNGNIPYWYIGTEQGKTVGGSYHNVVVLTPKPGNPLPPMTLDSFHYPFGPRTCQLGTYQDFKKKYPGNK